ncbi:MFS transporter, putative metabolite transport protein [Peribacillus simplex]|uniref:MFS transporter, putative metabolite transport protein n=1 Tax=Peribacillus simplex TaxID=1478 RepID=A0A9X8R8E5_9BACI|nr:MFS transporter [Peribacillus simplex]SIR04020.1 MFS transporter, putative metabolite transport protein [Peribacillus simplex]
MNKVRTLEEMPLGKFHYQMFFYTGGGAFIDGYIIGIIAVALAVLQPQFDMSLTVVGMIAMAMYVGMFFGGIIGGYLTDLIGRKTMFLLDLAVFVLASIPQFFVNDPVQLIILRFILGVAVGADNPISATYMAEFAPRKQRGALLGGLIALWYVGYGASFLVGYWMLGLGEDSWRWMLASSAVPALILLLGRLKMPESPLWLASKGKEKEANAIIQGVFGKGVVLSESLETKEKTSFMDMFKNGYGKWTLFIALFWTLQVAPAFAIATYIPQVLGEFGFADGNKEYLGSAIMSLFYLVGLLPAVFLVEKIGRRPVLIWPFLVSAVVLVILGITSSWQMSFAFTISLFIIYGIFNTSMNIHQWIYPNELFPTKIRGTAVGFGTGVSRIGASLSTFLFPLILSTYGIAVTMYCCAALFFIGFLISFVMAPETRNMTLAETSALNKPSSKPGSELNPKRETV